MCGGKGRMHIEAGREQVRLGSELGGRGAFLTQMRFIVGTHLFPCFRLVLNGRNRTSRRLRKGD
jgi:hypothetical protein